MCLAHVILGANRKYILGTFCWGVTVLSGSLTCEVHPNDLTLRVSGLAEFRPFLSWSAAPICFSLFFLVAPLKMVTAITYLKKKRNSGATFGGQRLDSER